MEIYEILKTYIINSFLRILDEVIYHICGLNYKIILNHIF